MGLQFNPQSISTLTLLHDLLLVGDGSPKHARFICRLNLILYILNSFFLPGFLCMCFYWPTDFVLKKFSYWNKIIIVEFKNKNGIS